MAQWAGQIHEREGDRMLAFGHDQSPALSASRR